MKDILNINLYLVFKNLLLQNNEIVNCKLLFSSLKHMYIEIYVIILHDICKFIIYNYVSYVSITIY